MDSYHVGDQLPCVKHRPTLQEHEVDLCSAKEDYKYVDSVVFLGDFRQGKSLIHLAFRERSLLLS